MLDCIDNVLSVPDVKKIRRILGAASFVDGLQTAGGRAKRVKQNEQVSASAEGRAEIDRLVRDALMKNGEIRRLALPKRVTRPMFSRYGPGDNYGLHTDDALMGDTTKIRTDLSVTIFISQADSYEGGELEIRLGAVSERVKLPAGCAVLYPSTTLHRVLPVTQGERLVALAWIESHVRSAEKREILADLDRVKDRMANLAPDEVETDLVHKTRSNLLRLWAET